MDAIFQFLRRRAVRKAPEPSPKTSPKHTFEGHQDDIWSFVFLQDNAHIVSGSEDGTMRKWDCETGQLVGESWKGKDAIYALALSPDGKTIACGRSNGSVEQWDTDGQMKEGIWTGHSDWVWSVSWSPSGGHLASGSWDGTILVRRVESSAVEVGPIKTNQGSVNSVAYSPLGDRIASGGTNESICIWDSHTGELLVGPINDLGSWVESVVWSSDGSKLYSASGLFARVFDSMSGTLLHRFQHDVYLRSVALSPTHNLLACVGWGGTAQLWDTVSHQPFPINSQASNDLRHVSFSPDGQYLAYGGWDKKITLWTVGDAAEPVVTTASTSVQDGTQQQILPKSPSSSSLNAGDTNLLEQSAANDEQGHKNLYGGFFTHSHSSLPSPSPNPARRRHLRDVLHRRRNNTFKHKPFTGRMFKRRTSSQPPANCEPPQPRTKGKSRVVNQGDERDDINSSDGVAPGPTERSNDKGKQRQDPIADGQPSTPGDISSLGELDTNENWVLWKSLFRSRKNDTDNVPDNRARDSSSRVVEVFPLRYPAVFVPHKWKHKKKSAPTGGSSQSGPSTHGDPSHSHTLSQGQAGPSSQPVTGYPAQPLHGNDDSNSAYVSISDTNMQGPFLKCLNKLCFPCGN